MEAIVNNLIKATGWSIFHSLWQAAIIYGILLATVSLFPKMTARLKHNLAYGAMCLIFTGFVLTFFSVFKWPVNDTRAPVAAIVQKIVNEQPVPGLSETISSQTERLFPYIVSIYGIGLLFQLMILGAGYKKLQLLKQSGKTQVPQAWQHIFEEMRSKLGLRRPIRFYLSDRVNIPLVIGYFKPIVLFPVALVTQLDMKQVEAILIHELSHIRRNDYLLNLIKTAIETLMFFNPFIWLSNRLVGIEREHACDDLVLKLTGTPLTYAHALLKLEILKDKTTPVLSMAATGKQQHLYQRIKRITDMKTNYMNAKQQIFAIALTVATVISLAWINPAKTRPVVTRQNVKPALTAVPEPGNLFNANALKTKNKPAAISSVQDTTKKKRRFKIVTVDAQGNRQEYNSVKEMPDSLRKEVISDTFVGMGNFHLDYKLNLDIDSTISKNIHFLKSPQWHADRSAMYAETIKKFNSAEWKKQQKELQKEIAKNTDNIRQHFRSRDWSDQQRQAAELARDLHLKFDTQEFKRDLSRQIEDAHRRAESAQSLLSSPAFRKKLDDAKALENSSEYKALKKRFDAEVEALKKKKAAQPGAGPF